MSNQERDYDIISAKYKCYNDEKVNLDKELSKLQTAKIFYKNNDYNPVKGVYFNHEKEEAFQKALEEKKKNWGKDKLEKMPKCAKGRSDIYDLISLKIVDKKEFDKMVSDERNKKKRYEIRSEMEKYYHERTLQEQDKEKARYLKIKKYNESNAAKSNISSLQLRNKLNDWEKILKGAGNNNTFKVKQIYKDPFEHFDAGKDLNKFKLVRNKTVAALPKIEEDKNFIRKKKISKCISHGDMKRNVSETKYEFNKEKFFNVKPKDIDLKNMKYNTNKNIRKRDREFLMNKEKNTHVSRIRGLDFSTQPDNGN